MNANDQHHHAEPSHPTGYDKHEVSVLGIALVAIGSVIFLVVSGALLDTYFVFEREKISYEQKLKPREERLLTTRDKESQRMHSYGYADSTHVMAHIPIDSAIDLLVRERAQEASAAASAPAKAAAKPERGHK